MTFEFNNQLVPQNTLDIEDIGQFGVEASNDEGCFYYLVVKSCMGIATIATCGPILPDIAGLPSGFKMTLDKMEFRADKLAKTINFWLNDKSKQITNAQVLPMEDAVAQFRELKDYLLNFNEDNF